MPRDSSIPLTVAPKQEQAHEEQANNNPVEVTKEPSFTEKMRNFFSSKEQKEGTKEKLEKQKQELTQVVENYKKERSDVVGSSKQDKTSLLKEVGETIQELKNLSGGSLGDNKEKAEQAYENLEAKITNTKESISFESDFIKQAIENLEGFKKALEGANFNSTPSELPDNSAENLKALNAAGFSLNEKVSFIGFDQQEYTGTIKSVSDHKSGYVIISFGDKEEYSLPIGEISKVSTVQSIISAPKAKTFLDGVTFANKKNTAWPKAEFDQAKNEITQLNSDAEFINQLSALSEYRDNTVFESVKEVLLIQLALTKLGYKPGTVDGVYRNSKDWDKKKYSETMRAVRAFQTVNTDVDGKKLVIDGIVGAKTLAKMVAELRKSTTPSKDASVSEEKTSTPKKQEGKNSGETITVEGGVKTIQSGPGTNPQTIETTGEITPLNRTKRQGKEQFEKEEGTQITKNEKGEYTGNSAIKWENSHYNPESKAAENERFIALSKLPPSEAITYVNAHKKPETTPQEYTDNAVKRYVELVESNLIENSPEALGFKNGEVVTVNTVGFASYKATITSFMKNSEGVIKANISYENDKKEKLTGRVPVSELSKG